MEPLGADRTSRTWRIQKAVVQNVHGLFDRGCQSSALSYVSVHLFEGNDNKARVFASKPALRNKLVAAVLKKTYECGPGRVGPSRLRSSHEFPYVWIIAGLGTGTVHPALEFPYVWIRLGTGTVHPAFEFRSRGIVGTLGLPLETYNRLGMLSEGPPPK